MQLPRAVIGAKDLDIFDHHLCSRSAAAYISFTGIIPGRPNIIMVNNIVKTFAGKSNVERQDLELGLIKEILQHSTNTRLNFKLVCLNGILTGGEGLGKNGVGY